MNRQFWLVLTLGSLTMGLATQAQAKLYKWVDEKGEVHYGDKIPPKYYRQKHQELNSQGVQLKAVDRKKTDAEKRAEREAQTEEQKRIHAERKIQAEKLRKDRILLDTFTVERDLLLMRDDRLSAIESTTNLTLKYNNQIEKQLIEAQQHIDNLEEAKREVPDNLIKTVRNLEGQLGQNVAHLARLNKDKILLEKQFKEDLARFRELKGIAVEVEVAENTEEIYIDEQDIPTPKGYFYGYPIFPDSSGSQRYDSFKSEHVFIETDAQMSVIKSFFKLSPEMAVCSKGSYGYSCPYDGSEGKGKVTIKVSGWQKRGRARETSISYQYRPIRESKRRLY